MANIELIETKTVGAGGTAYIEFTSIPQTYTDLTVKVSLRGDTTFDLFWVRFNSVSTNLSGRSIQGDGSSAASYIVEPYGRGQTSSNTANTFSSTDIYIPNYTSSNNKSICIDSVSENNATQAYTTLGGGLWSSSSAITSIQLVPNGGNFVENSTVSLYGISSAAIRSTPYATGGTIYQDSTYFYHMFTTTETLTPSQAISNVDYLVVAGGGGAGYGGGGGAGGLRCTVNATGGGGSLPSKISLASGTAYTITVGSGGTGTQSYANGSAGSASSIIGGAISISTVGGGAGGGTTPTTGGSGGGYGNNTTGSGAAGTSNEGYAGGNGSADRGGGGGGGAGFAGQNGVGIATGFAGKGGDGIFTTIGGTDAYYAGGGGGAFNGTANQNQGAGGLGGGGTGGTNGAAGQKGGTDGLASTGGGGGACNMNAPIAGNGGSGIVIVRYAK
jgi:hypothetical protein